MKTEEELKEAAGLIAIALLQGTKEPNLSAPGNDQVVANAAHMLSVLLWCLNDPPRESFPDFDKLVTVLRRTVNDG